MKPGWTFAVGIALWMGLATLPVGTATGVAAAATHAPAKSKGGAKVDRSKARAVPAKAKSKPAIPSARRAMPAAKKSSTAWIWLAGLFVLGGVGAVAYWKRQQLMALIPASKLAGFKSKVSAAAKEAASSRAASFFGEVSPPGGDQFGDDDKGVTSRAPAPAPAQRPAAQSPATQSPAAKSPAAKSGKNPYAPVHGIDVKTYAKLNAERNLKGAFDDEALAVILHPHGLTLAQFTEVEATWQSRMADGEQDPLDLRAVHDEFNRASAEAMASAA